MEAVHCLTTSSDSVTNSEINSSDNFFYFFFPAESVAPEIFYRSQELRLAMTFWIEIYPLALPSFVLFIGVAHSSPQLCVNLALGLLPLLHMWSLIP